MNCFSLLIALILCVIYSQISHYNSELLKDRFQQDICDENYFDAAFVVDDGNKIVRKQSLWTYGLDLNFVSLEKQETYLKEYDQKLESGKVKTGFFIPEVKCSANESSAVPPQGRAVNISGKTTSPAYRFKPCSLAKRWDSNLMCLVFQDLETQHQLYHFKRKNGTTYDEIINPNERPYKLFTRYHFGSNILPNASYFGRYHEFLPVIYDHKDMKIFVIRNVYTKKEDEWPTLNMNSFRYMIFTKTWKIVQISKSYTYIGFVRKREIIYILAEPFRYKSQDRGPTKLFRLDIENMALIEESSDAMTLFGCEPDNDYELSQEEWAAYTVMTIIMAILITIVVALILYFGITLSYGKQRHSVSSDMTFGILSRKRSSN